MKSILFAGALCAVLLFAAAGTADALSISKNPNDCTTPILVDGE